MKFFLLFLSVCLGMMLPAAATAAVRVIASAPTPAVSEAATHLSPRQQKRLERLERKQAWQAKRQTRRRGDSPAGKFFLSLGLAIGLGLLAFVFIDIAALSLALTIAGGVAFFVALWFLIRWLYYYW